MAELKTVPAGWDTTNHRFTWLADGVTGRNDNLGAISETA